MKPGFLAVIIGIVFVASVVLNDRGSHQARGSEKGMAELTDAKTEVATLGGGCFWCLEAVFQRIDGVKSVTSGYAGGTVANPSYEEVCTGKTGHAEVVQIGVENENMRREMENFGINFYKMHRTYSRNL